MLSSAQRRRPSLSALVQTHSAVFVGRSRFLIVAVVAAAAAYFQTRSLPGRLKN